MRSRPGASRPRTAEDSGRIGPALAVQQVSLARRPPPVASVTAANWVASVAVDSVGSGWAYGNPQAGRDYRVSPVTFGGADLPIRSMRLASV